MNVFRALLVRFFGFDYVFLIHHDGEHQLRRAFVVGKYFFSYSASMTPTFFFTPSVCSYRIPKKIFICCTTDKWLSKYENEIRLVNIRCKLSSMINSGLKNNQLNGRFVKNISSGKKARL